MALSEAQKAQVRLYLGFDRGYDLHPALESRFQPGALTSDEESLIGTTLTNLAAIDTKLQTAALTRLDASRVEDIELLGPAQLDALRAHGRMLVGRLGAIFAVEPLRDVFAVGSAASMGGLIPLG